MNVELEALKKRLYVDNHVKNVQFFQRSALDASLEDFAREMNKFFVEAENVEVEDELSKAVAAAHARADKIYAEGADTLVDQIPISDSASWDASDELAIVADPDGLDLDGEG